MKLVLRILLLGFFLFMIFIKPEQIGGPAVFWSLYALVIPVLYLYWRVCYFVSRRNMLLLEKGKVDFDVFCAKFPPETKDDLIRGRMAVVNRGLRFYVRDDGAKEKCRLEWSCEADELASIGFGKQLPLRYGFIVHLKDGTELRFSCNKIKKHKRELFEALGWPYAEV